MQRLTLCLGLALWSASPAWAQGRDEALPYSDDDEAEAPAPKKKKVHQVLEETEDERRARARSLTSVDDANIGLSAEIISGLALIEASRGALDARFQFGARLTWEWGRLLSNEVAREVLFLDVNWLMFSVREGSNEIFASTSYHHLTLTPGFAIPAFGLTSPVTFFVAAGAGLHLQSASISALTVVSSVSASRLVLQYGGGMRFRIPLTQSKNVRLSFRIEFTRFRRAYMDDNFIGGSLGLTF